MNRWIPIVVGLFALSGMGVHASESSAATQSFPAISIKTGSASAIDGRQLLAKDKNGITIKSDKVVASQMLAFKVTIPIPENAPENPAAARIAFAMHGSSPVPIKSSVWLPKSRVWQTLATDFMPTDKGSIVFLSIGLVKQALAGKDLEVLIRLEDHNPGADQFSIFVDAAMLQVSAAKRAPKKSAHALAASAGGGGPTVQVHSFAGNSSSSYEQKKQAILKGFEKPPPKPKTAKKKPKKKKKKK
jgi:hypothetical protein